MLIYGKIEERNEQKKLFIKRTEVTSTVFFRTSEKAVFSRTD